MSSHTTSLKPHLKIGFTFDRRSEWLALGYSDEECAEFDVDDTIENIAAALRTFGEVELIGGFKSLTTRLQSAYEWDVIFNICEGFGFNGREAQVPAILEAYNICFTFSDSATSALCLDKAKTKMVLEYHGIPTAPFAVVPPMNQARPSQNSGKNAIQQSPHRDALQVYPLFAKPSSEGTGKGISAANKIHSPEELETVVQNLLVNFPNQSILIERFLGGREFTVGIVGTGDEAQVVGVREIIYAKNKSNLKHISSSEFDPSLMDDVYSFGLKKIVLPFPEYCNIKMDDPIFAEVANVALKTWKVMTCRDGGRIDIRYDNMDHSAVPNVIEINPLAGLSLDSDFPKLAKDNGIGYEELLRRILLSALCKRKGSQLEKTS